LFRMFEARSQPVHFPGNCIYLTDRWTQHQPSRAVDAPSTAPGCSGPLLYRKAGGLLRVFRVSAAPVLSLHTRP
jgi:hypothetical protein